MAKSKKLLRKICSIYADYGSKGLRLAILNKLHGRGARYGFNALRKDSYESSADAQSDNTLIDGKGLGLQRVKATAPVSSDWLSISASNTCQSKSIDVIIPVYDGYDETLRCIYSVMNAKTKIAFELIVIVDKSPNEELVEEIRRLSDLLGFTLIENDVNLGFVRTMNVGMQLHPHRDVIWLNSDTEVFDYWIDRFVDLSLDNHNIATITPLSNNATFCSYPVTRTDNFLPLDTSDYVIDRICSDVNHKVWVETPTGVGFCMYVRRKALDEVGLLDDVRFGKGYGEENDLCQRFIHHGWKNAILASVFVRHYGSVSFKASALKRQKDASEVMTSLHPDYKSQLQRWIARDPLRIARARIDCARLVNKQTGQKEKRVLLVSLSRGGGTEFFVQDVKLLLGQSNISAFILRPDKNGNACLDVNEFLYPNIKHIHAGYDLDFMCELLKSLQISAVHINHVIDFNPLFADMLRVACLKLSIPITVTIHDYFSFCPLITLLPDGRDYCSVYSEKKCNECTRLVRCTPHWARKDSMERLFKAAVRITVPCNDVKARLETVFPGVQFVVVPHRERRTCLYDQKLADQSKNSSVIAFIGSISVAKGFNVILGIAKVIKSQKLPIKLVVIGTSCDNKLLERNGVIVTGRYSSEQEACDLMDLHKVSAIFLPSIWPETYSYTCSIALRSGKPTFVFDLGAPAERLRNLNLQDFIIPLNLKDRPERLVEILAEKAEACRDIKYHYDDFSPTISDYFPTLESIDNKTYF